MAPSYRWLLSRWSSWPSVRSTLTSDISRAKKVGEYPAETQDTNGGQDNARGRESRVDPYGQGPENKTQFRIIVLL